MLCLWNLALCLLSFAWTCKLIITTATLGTLQDDFILLVKHIDCCWSLLLFSVTHQKLPREESVPTLWNRHDAPTGDTVLIIVFAFTADRAKNVTVPGRKRCLSFKPKVLFCRVSNCLQTPHVGSDESDCSLCTFLSMHSKQMVKQHKYRIFSFR